MHGYNAFGPHIKKLFGETVYKVNIDAGFTCPNRDGTLGKTGCIYCNNDSFKPSSCKPVLSVREQVAGGIAYLKKRYGVKKFIAYFQAFSNTYASVDVLERLYKEALEEPSIVGLAIGTRPDCVDDEKLDMIASISEGRYILMEYGIQSIYQKSLEFIKRGHDLEAFVDAVGSTRKRGMEVGAHIIVGFPTETRDETLAMAEALSAMDIGYLKIHQLQVVSGTPLAKMFEREPFHVFGYEEYLDFLVDFVERLRPDIVLQRLFATAPDAILIAPQWGKSRQGIIRDIDRRFESRGARQGRLYGVSKALLPS